MMALLLLAASFPAHAVASAQTDESAIAAKRTKKLPSEPQNVQLTIRGGDDLRLRFDAPADDGGGRIRGYRIRVNSSPLDRSSTKERVYRIGTKRDLRFRNVRDGFYSVEVSAQNSKGWGPWARSHEVVVGTAPQVAPEPPDRRIGPFRSASSFVDQQYVDLFGRAADEGGRTYWASLLNDDGSNAPEVIDAMMSAPEFRPSYQALSLYLAYFNRLPDNEGLNYWVDVLKQDRASLRAASSAFASSAEFRARYGSLDDRNFVALVYNNVLLRTPDPAGYDYWIRQLRNGLSRGELMILFSDSEEFVLDSNPAVYTVAIYNAMLDRSPTPEEFQRWIAHIGANPSDRIALIEGIFNGGTYRNRIT